MTSIAEVAALYQRRWDQQEAERIANLTPSDRLVHDLTRITELSPAPPEVKVRALCQVVFERVGRRMLRPRAFQDPAHLALMRTLWAVEELCNNNREAARDLLERAVVELQQSLKLPLLNPLPSGDEQ